MFEDCVLQTVKNLSVHERRRASILNLVQHKIKLPPNPKGTICLEHEIGLALEAELGPPQHGGVWFPLILMTGLDTKSNSSGGYTVETKVFDVVTYLRNKSICMTLGATLLPDLKGPVAIPTQASGTVASFVVDNPGSDLSASDSTFGQISLSPHSMQSVTSYSRQLLEQTSGGTEALLRGDIAAAHAAAIDAASFSGSGSSNQPVGLQNNANVPVIALGTNGAAPDGAHLCQMEQSVADASADLGTLSWATTPTMRAKLRQTPLFTGATVPCWEGDEGEDFLLGSPAVVSKSVPQGIVKGSSNDCHLIAVGYFPALVIGTWGAMEISIDPYSSKKKNVIEICSYSMVDIACRRPTAFALCSDARNV